jgi:hypothetical protein
MSHELKRGDLFMRMGKASPQRRMHMPGYRLYEESSHDEQRSSRRLIVTALTSGIAKHLGE